MQGGIRRRSECSFVLFFVVAFFPASRPHSCGLGSAKLRPALFKFRLTPHLNKAADRFRLTAHVTKALSPTCIWSRQC